MLFRSRPGLSGDDHHLVIPDGGGDVRAPGRDGQLLREHNRRHDDGAPRLGQPRAARGCVRGVGVWGAADLGCVGARTRSTSSASAPGPARRRRPPGTITHDQPFSPGSAHLPSALCSRARARARARRCGVGAPQQTRPMTGQLRHHAIDYIEIPATDVTRAKQFYAEAFGWRFTDYGPDYAEIGRASCRERV